MTTPAEILWYTLDDDAASTTVLDVSGNGNTAVLAGGHTTADLSVAGAVGKALQLDGTADFINGGNIPVCSGSQVTLFARVKCNNLEDEQTCIMGTYDTAANRCLAMLQRQDKIQVNFGNPTDGSFAGFAVTVGSVITLGDYTDIAVVYDAGNLGIYINRQLASHTITGNIPSSLYASSTDFLIGAFRTAGVPGSYFAGSIDDVRVYGHALSQGQVNALHNGGAGTNLSLTQIVNATTPLTSQVIA